MDKLKQKFLNLSPKLRIFSILGGVGCALLLSCCLCSVFVTILTPNNQSGNANNAIGKQQKEIEKKNEVNKVALIPNEATPTLTQTIVTITTTLEPTIITPTQIPTLEPTKITPQPTSIPTKKSTPVPLKTTAPQKTPVSTPIQNKYVCNCSKTCPNMTCPEAQYQLNICGCSARDKDNDGIACDTQCG